MPRFLVFDIGTSAGRAMLGTLHDDRLALDPVCRFPNRAVPVRGTLYWDILYLWDGILDGLREWVRHDDPALDGIGLDTWAVDFALLDAQGALLDNPVSNRDRRTDGLIGRVLERIPREELHARTGIQFMQINTLYQLYALARAGSPTLHHADTFLSVADLLNYWLTGRKVVEFSSATCTQFYDPIADDWARDLLERLDIPTAMLPEVVSPGTVLGPLDTGLPELAALEGENPVPVIAVVTHDTGSAVAAVPVDPADTGNFAYISSGTWSLMGTEVPAPVITPDTLRYDFTNEGGINRTFRLLKNILGMWLVQACQEVWAGEGTTLTDADCVALAAAAPPFGPVIDPYPNSPDFRTPGDMPARIRAFCQRTDQPIPADKGAVLRCIFESLALKYRQTLDQLEIVLGHPVNVIHIVGGGSQNALLCQMTADATVHPVIAGPAEATSLGNLVTQAMATGFIASLADARALIRRSVTLVRYEPAPSAAWDDAYRRFLATAGQ
ncbi:MAG: rhamnulokinase [Anaerolineae bacterium]|nr:rhamnulokinase [Anaerolineae bacterium]